MNKKFLLLCLILVVVIAGASTLYNGLAYRVETENLATVTTVAPATESEATQPPAEKATEEPDYSAPNFSMATWDGNVVRLADYFGKPIILNFWASWCDACKRGMPAFQEVYEKYGDEIHFIMLNCTIGDSETDAKALIEENGYTFPVYFDTTSLGAYSYGASSIPLTYFIDGEGNLLAYYMGAMSGNILQQGVDLLYTPADAE